jgi:hypothetical protein
MYFVVARVNATLFHSRERLAVVSGCPLPLQVSLLLRVKIAKFRVRMSSAIIKNRWMTGRLAVCSNDYSQLAILVYTALQRKPNGDSGRIIGCARESAVRNSK